MGRVLFILGYKGKLHPRIAGSFAYRPQADRSWPGGKRACKVSGMTQGSVPTLLCRRVAIVGFHMTSLKFKVKKTIHPTEILLSRCIRAAEN